MKLTTGQAKEREAVLRRVRAGLSLRTNGVLPFSQVALHAALAVLEASSSSLDQTAAHYVRQEVK